MINIYYISYEELFFIFEIIKYIIFFINIFFSANINYKKKMPKKNNKNINICFYKIYIYLKFSLPFPDYNGIYIII